MPACLTRIAPTRNRDYAAQDGAADQTRPVTAATNDTNKTADATNRTASMVSTQPVDTGRASDDMIVPSPGHRPRCAIAAASRFVPAGTYRCGGKGLVKNCCSR